MLNWNHEKTICTGLFIVVILVAMRIVSGQLQVEPIEYDKTAISVDALKAYKVSGTTVYVNKGEYIEPTMIGDDTLPKAKYDTLANAIEASTDSTTVEVVKSHKNSIKWNIINTAKKDIVYTGTFAVELARFFYVGDLVNVKTGERMPSNAAINYKTGTYTVTIQQGWMLDPGYSAAPKAVSASFNLAGEDNTVNDSTANTIAETGLLVLLTCNGADTAEAVMTDQMGNYDGTMSSNAMVAHSDSNRSSVRNDFDEVATSDGSSAKINCGNISELEGAANFSFSLWAKQRVLDQNDYILTIGPGTNGIVMQTYTDGKFYFGVGTGDYCIVGNYSDYVTAGEWHHWVVTYDGGGADNDAKCDVWIDGVEVDDASSGTIPTTTPSNGNDFMLGTTVSANSFDGLVDNIGVWAVTLTGEQIRTLYSAQRARPVRDSTATGNAYIDSAWNHTELDTVIFNIAGDSVLHPMAGGLVADISSILTDGALNTVIITGTNNVGRGGAVSQSIWKVLAYSAGYDTNYTDTSSTTECKDSDTLYTIRSDTMRVDSVNITPNDDTTSNWLVEFREAIDTVKTDPTRDTVWFASDTAAGTVYATDLGASGGPDSTGDTVTARVPSGDTVFVFSFLRWTSQVCSTNTDSTHTVLTVDSVSRVLSGCAGNPITARDTFDNDDEYYEDSAWAATQFCEAVIIDTVTGDTLSIDTLISSGGTSAHNQRPARRRSFAKDEFAQPIWKDRKFEW